MSVLRVKRPFDNIFDPFTSTESHCTGHIAKKEYFPSFASSEFALTDAASSAQLHDHHTVPHNTQPVIEESSSRKRFRPPSPAFHGAATVAAAGTAAQPSSSSSSSLWSIDYDDDTMTPSSPPTHASSYRRSPTREPSPFAAAAVPPMNIERFIHTKRHKHSHIITTPPATSQPNTSAPHSSTSTSALYTSNDVRRMLTDALTTREKEIRDEYDRVLTELLSQQFDHFNRFNKDYISKQINKNELSYLS